MAADHLIAKIDSASTMLLAVANFMRGKDIDGLGFVPSSAFLAIAANLPPKPLRQYVYILGGRKEAALPEVVANLKAEELSRWAVKHYSRRLTAPAVMIGSSNGALVHLCTALKIPWLPQTVLVPIRRPARMLPDELKGDMESFRDAAGRLLERNPELQVNQMHDPVQDRLMVQQMGYFRVKRLTLGKTYEQFLERTLPPGGTIFVSECTYSWPMAPVGPRHFFQVGGYGGVEAKEYLAGSSRISKFLRKDRSKLRHWDVPVSNIEKPEAEWGFEPSLLDDIRRIAKKRHYKICRIRYHDPAAVSPFVADLYRWWYAERGIAASRLFAESFLLMDPWWCLKTGSVPFWKVFNTGRSADALRAYIKRRGPFDEIYITLFANSIKGIDQTPIKEWKTIFKQARKKGAFVGVAESAYPYDLGVFLRFHLDLKKRMSERLPMPKSLTLKDLERFRKTAPGRDRSAQWIHEN